MAEVKTLFKGTPVMTTSSLNKLREMKEEDLVTLYIHTNDTVQMILIEEICKLKGYTLPEIMEEPPRMG